MNLSKGSLPKLEAMGREATKHIKKHMVVGLGSGSAVSEFVKALGDFPKSTIATIRFVPTSLQIQFVAETIGLNIIPQPESDFMDLVVDGADQIDKKGAMIKGGGGALFREKILLSMGKNNIILADASKYVDYLSRAVPIEVDHFARLLVKEKLEKMGGKPCVRVNEKGYPMISENGNILYDVDFGLVKEPSKLERSLQDIHGIIENGIFTCRVDTFYQASGNGEVHVFHPV